MDALEVKRQGLLKAYQNANNRGHGDKTSKTDGQDAVDFELVKAQFTSNKNVRQKEAMGDLFSYDLLANPVYESTKDIIETYYGWVEFKNRENEGWFA